MSEKVLFRSPGLGDRRSEVVRRFHFPSEGVTRVDADTLAINHARKHQAPLTQAELEKVLGITVEIETGGS